MTKTKKAKSTKLETGKHVELETYKLPEGTIKHFIVARCAEGIAFTGVGVDDVDILGMVEHVKLTLLARKIISEQNSR